LTKFPPTKGQTIQLFHAGLHVVLDGQQHFSAWHTFLIVCAVPTPLAIIGLLALPESPRILLEIGHEREALVIYQVTLRFLVSSMDRSSSCRLLVSENISKESPQIDGGRVQSLRSRFALFAARQRGATGKEFAAG
jgi:Sugar (and other) transporter